jgi:hypothetical protein
MYFETVATETPAAAATPRIVVAPFFAAKG